MTDELNVYPTVTKGDASHATVKHGEGEFARGDVHSNTVEGFFSLVKRSIYGIYHNVSRRHLHRYRDEREFTHNFRGMTERRTACAGNPASRREAPHCGRVPCRVSINATSGTACRNGLTRQPVARNRVGVQVHPRCALRVQGSTAPTRVDCLDNRNNVPLFTSVIGLTFQPVTQGNGTRQAPPVRGAFSWRRRYRTGLTYKTNRPPRGSYVYANGASRFGVRAPALSFSPSRPSDRPGRFSRSGAEPFAGCARSVLYLDACAVVKRYVDEHDGATAIMEEIMMDAAPWGGLIASEWLVLEVTSTLAKKVRTARISERAYRALLRRFRTDAEAIDLLPVDSTTVDSATRLMEQAGPARSFHSGDAVHLYTAIQVRDAVSATDTFVVVSADKGLNGVATSHGLVVFDPRLQSIADLETLFGR